MSKENPTINEMHANRAAAHLELAISFTGLASASAAQWPGWQSTFDNLRQSIEATAKDFRRWQEQQEKGGAL